MWCTYRARWRGEEYPAVPDARPGVLMMRLYGSLPADGFDEIAEGRYVQVVPASDCEVLLLATTVCEWRGAPFHVHDERDDELLLEYVGGLLPVAERLGLERIERGVHRAWVPRAEVRGLRESVTVLQV